MENETPGSKKVELQHVLGVTITNNCALDSDPQTGTVAYPAGCVVVLYNTRKNKQRHIVLEAKRTITCLAYSWDGKYLVTGECGAVSHVRVWDAQKLVQIADLSGHKQGINCVAFSPNLKYVVSVGSQHDMVVNVWDWRNKQRVASNKVSCKVKALSFAAGGNYFVTVGNNHVKFWYLEYSRSTKSKNDQPVPLMGRSAILGDQRTNCFCAVGCGRGEAADSTFAVTKSGLLCEFNGRRLLDKWVELRISAAFSLAVSESLVLIGCSDGIVRCFSPLDLHFVCTLPRPHFLGVDVAKGLTGKQMSSHPAGSKYPDVIAITLDEANKKVTCVHSDHSMYVWDIRDVKKIGKSHSFLYHSACIWGIEAFPEIGEGGSLPEGTFFTCASDDTIRVWNLDSSSNYKRNVYCQELLKILYTDPNLVFLCDIDLLPAETNEKLVNSYDGKNGVRCLKVRPDGQHLATGDRSGNIRIYDLKYLELLCKIEAHDAEVLCLEYSDTESGLLCSGSRDRLLHVFEGKEKYTLWRTQDEHTSSVTAARFLPHTKLVSCGADARLVIRTLPKGSSQQRSEVVPGQSTFYDLECIGNRILAACQDGRVRVYDVDSPHKSLRELRATDAALIKMSVDPSGRFVATSSTDKTIRILDVLSGELKVSMTGHSELVTGLRFMPSGKHLISVSGDGCIFVWKISLKSSSTDLPLSSGVWKENRKNAIAVAKPLHNNLTDDRKETIPLDLNDGQLPSWATKQNSDEWKSGGRSSPPPAHPRGRWGQRLEGQALIVKSYSATDTIIPIPQIAVADSKTPPRSSPTHLKEDTKQRRRHGTDSSSASSLRLDDGDDERSDSGATDEQLIYYPQPQDSSFQINANVEERRFSQTTGLQRSTSAFCVPEKSATDEEDATPGLGVSTENLDRLGMRERFMLDTFEHMHDSDTSSRTTTLSARHHGTSVSGRKTNLMSSKKREELTRALNDARKKLETLGFKGGLSSSKSVGDLSHAGEDTFEKPVTPSTDSMLDMRRSTSFGDIRSGMPRRRLPYTPQPGGPGSAPLWEQAKTIRFEDSPKVIKPTTPVQADIRKSVSSLSVNVRPATSGRRLSLTGVSRRPRSPDSSSSEASPTEGRGGLVPRGIVARRMKAFGAVETSRSPSKSRSEWDLRKLGDRKEQLEASPQDPPVRDSNATPALASNYLDLNTTPLTKELCERVSDDLKKVTSFAVQLFQRVTVDNALSTEEKASMTTTLAQGVWQAQRNLQPTPVPPAGDPHFLLQQYSDKLLTLIEQRITQK